jgi:hypothetical protein
MVLEIEHNWVKKETEEESKSRQKRKNPTRYERDRIPVGNINPPQYHTLCFPWNSSKRFMAFKESEV